MIDQQVEIEQTAAAAIMHDRHALDAAIALGVGSQHFKNELASTAVSAVMGLWQKESKFSFADIVAKVGTGRRDELTALKAKAPIALNIKPFLQALVDADKHAEIQSRLLAVGRLLHQRQPMESLSAVVEALGELTAFAGGDERSLRTVKMSDALHESILSAESRILADGMPGITTGIPGLDVATYGFQPGFVYILGARTSVGKTTLAVNFALTAAEAGHKTAFVTVEMGATDICDKMIGKVGKINLGRYFSGELTPDELDRVQLAVPRLSTLPVVFTEVNSPKIEALALEALRLVRGGVKFLIVDYLQLFEVGDGKFRQSREEAKIVSSRLKQLARTLKVPVLVLSQLNREAPEYGEPDLKHVAETDQIVRDADVVMFLYREKIHAGIDDDYWLAIAKQRRGKMTRIKLVADLNTGSFREAAPHE